MLTAIEHGSVGPKRMVKTISESKAVFKQGNFFEKIPPHDSKGKKVNIPLPRWGDYRRALFRQRACSIGGNANKRIDAVGRMGKSCLFFLSLLSFQRVPGIDSLEDRRRSKRKIIRF